MTQKKGKIDKLTSPSPTKINWKISSNIITRFAHNVLVQLMDTEVKMMFFELKPEIKLDATTEPLKEVDSDCVASVIIPAEKIAKLIEILQQQLDHYNSQKQPH